MTSKPDLSPGKLRALRLQQGLTKRALADKTGLNWLTIRDYEWGRRSPAQPNFNKLMHALGCRAADLKKD